MCINQFHITILKYPIQDIYEVKTGLFLLMVLEGPTQDWTVSIELGLW